MDKRRLRKMESGVKLKKGVSRREFLKTSAAFGAGIGLTIFSPKWSFSEKTSEPINIGLLPCLTGIVSAWGDGLVKVAEMTVEEINQSGGLLGREVKLIIQDDGSVPENAVPAAERLVKRFGVVMFIGNLLSNSRLAVDNQVAEPHRVVMNNFSYYEGSICGRYFFHMGAVGTVLYSKTVPWMGKKFGKRFYFLGQEYEYPRGMIAISKDVVKKIEGEVVGEEYCPLGTQDFSSILMRIKRANPNVVMCWAAGADKMAFLKQFSAAGLKEKIGLTTDFDEIHTQGLPPEVRENNYSVNTYFREVPTKENKIFLERLEKKYGKRIPLGNFQEAIIPCIRIWANAVKKAGTTNPEEIVKAQEGGPGEKYGISVMAPQGKVTVVKKHHHCIVQVYMARSRSDGTFEVLEHFPEEEPIIPERYGDCVASVQYGCRPLKQKQCPKFPGE